MEEVIIDGVAYQQAQGTPDKCTGCVAAAEWDGLCCALPDCGATDATKPGIIWIKKA